MRALVATVGLVSALPVAADVMPHCGGPTVVVQSPGQECGHHGPRWRGDCRAPAACFNLESGGAKCTIGCATDEDCKALDSDFTCSDTGRPYPGGSGARRVCSLRPLARD